MGCEGGEGGERRAVGGRWEMGVVVSVLEVGRYVIDLLDLDIYLLSTC